MGTGAKDRQATAFEDPCHVMAGKYIMGFTVEETGDSLKRIDNRSAPDKITVVLETDIEERTPCDVSIMPKGMLNKLTREEIFDLLAYLLVGGDKENALFREHEH